MFLKYKIRISHQRKLKHIVIYLSYTIEIENINTNNNIEKN